MSPTAYRIVGTAGHIDHGKSTLVRALTGIDPDRLQEEQERGITIDLGFADATVEQMQIGFIDVPGHERFVKNMLAGIGGIDAVLLVVAADESIMPQTREHFAICRLLGVDRGVVAITKTDLVDPELVELVELEVEELLEDTPLAGSTIVHTAASDETSIARLRAALRSCLAGAAGRPADGLLRLPIDRVFSIRGFGTVVTGTLLSGSLRAGDRLTILPAGLATSVRGLQVHGTDAEEAHAGQRTAVNLHGVQVEEIERGMVLARPDTLRSSSMFDARVEVLPESEPLEHQQRVRFHHGAAEVLGRLATLESDTIEPGSTGLVQVRLEQPYPVAPGDRFVLRRYSPVTTLGGGIVIDTVQIRHRRRAEAASRLRTYEAATASERLALLVHAAGSEGIDHHELRLRLAVTEQRLGELIAEARGAGTIAELDGRADRLVDPRRYAELQEALLDRLAAYHAEWPLRPAMAKEDLRSRLPGRPSAPMLEAAAAALIAREAIRPAADGYALADHVVRLPAAMTEIRDRLLAAYESAGLAPEGSEEVLAREPDPDAAREVHRFLVRDGKLVRLRDDLVVHHEAMEKLLDAMARRFERGEQFSVADFKDWAGISRKHAIPLLEHLDAQRITRRVGDARERL